MQYEEGDRKDRTWQDTNLNVGQAAPCKCNIHVSDNYWVNPST